MPPIKVSLPSSRLSVCCQPAKTPPPRLSVLGLYAASKSAVTTFSETIRLELAPFGVKVLTVNTGVVATNLANSIGDLQLPTDSLFVPAKEALKERARGGGYAAMDPAVYAEKLVTLVENGSSGPVWLGNSATALRYARWLPTWIMVSWLPQIPSKKGVVWFNFFGPGFCGLAGLWT